jgi:hypothetical protein
MFKSCRKFIRCISHFFKLFHSPIDTVSRCCNMNRELSTIMYLHVNTRTTRKIKRFIKKVLPIRIEIEVLSAVVMKSNIFWDITPCSPLKINQCLGGSHCFYFQGKRWRR